MPRVTTYIYAKRTFNLQELEARVFSYLLENSISKF